MSTKALETDLRPRAEAAILNVIETLIAGWNAHDPKIYASVFAEDSDYVTVAGEWLRGRSELSGQFRSTTLRTDRISIRFIRPEVAVVHFRWEREGDPVRQGMTTILASEDRGRWRFDAAQNTDIHPD